MVPDLAVSVPAPSESGRTYRFQLRRGVRYSTGAAVRPSDVHHGIKRALRHGSVAGNFLGAIAGASRCSARACDLSRGIVVHQAAAAPLTNPGNVDVVSPRVGNYQFNPAADGILFDQLWLR